MKVVDTKKLRKMKEVNTRHSRKILRKLWKLKKLLQKP